jgi:hypothetical protein
MTWGAYGAQNPPEDGISWRDVCEAVNRPVRVPAPSRIRTCAHGSGGGRSHLSNLCILPAWTRSLISPAAKVIPGIFRIMDTSAVTACTLQGMARVRSRQAPAWPLVSDRECPQ